MTSDADDRLLAPYRGVRRVVAPAEGPWPGMLVHLPDGGSAVLVADDDLPADWRGWDASPTGHLLGPIDLVRTATGHAALIPACPERLDDFLRRRRDAGTPVAPGEAVTIGVSIVRGIAELAGAEQRTHGATGDWWLTDARRPVLGVDAVPPSGSGHARSRDAEVRDVADVSLSIVDELAAAVPDHVWTDLAALLGSDRITARDVARLEEALFSLAPAEPLADAPLARRRGLVPADTAETAPRTARELRSWADPAPQDDVTDRPQGNWTDQLTRHVDADLADLVSRATTGAWRRLTTRSARPARTRRAPWLVAAAVAVVVVAGGLLWPAGEQESIAADATTTPVPASPDPGTDASSPPASVPEPAAQPAVDLATQVARLLTERTACAGDARCLAAIVLDPNSALLPGVIDLDEPARGITLVDEFGGVAVLRADDLTGALPPQLLVVQQDGEKWLLRDVYAAQQP